MTTIGQLVSVLFTEYVERYQDERLAAVATQVVIDELLRERDTRRSRTLTRQLERAA